MAFIVKNTTFPNLLDVIAPLSCRGCGRLGSPLCDECKNYIIKNHKDYCPKCQHEKSALTCPNCQNLPKTFVLDVRTSIIGALIHDLKYNSLRALAPEIAKLLDATFPNPEGPVILVPLPTIPRHIRKRGLDHTYLITKHFARLRKKRGKNYKVEKLLIRNKNTTQVGTDAKTRQSQAKTAYTLAENIKIDEKATYVLFDDVWTTGASMENAYKTLLPAIKKALKNSGANPQDNLMVAVLALNTLN